MSETRGLDVKGWGPILVRQCMSKLLDELSSESDKETQLQEDDFVGAGQVASQMAAKSAGTARCKVVSRSQARRRSFDAANEVCIEYLGGQQRDRVRQDGYTVAPPGNISLA